VNRIAVTCALGAAISWLILSGCGGSETPLAVSPAPAPAAPPVLDAIRVRPRSIVLGPNDTHQFKVAAHWSDGSTLLPTIDFRTTGGWISTGGLYSAPPTPGTYQVTAQPQGGTFVDTAIVVVQAGAKANPTPWLVEDFGGYWTIDDFQADPKGIYSHGAGDNVNLKQMSVDPTDAPPGGSGSLVYTFADRSNDPNLCHDYSISKNLQLPKPVREVWIEIWTKFDSGFETLVPGGQCTGLSSNAYKFIFVRCRGGRCGRFESELGSSPNHLETIFGPGLVPPGTWQVIPIAASRLPFTAIVDQQWHRWRLHLRLGPDGRVAFGFDGSLVYDSATDPAQTHPTLVDAKEIYGIGLGRNLNQGPTHQQWLKWGLIEAFRTDPGWGW
jgi:hypothetical protein